MTQLAIMCAYLGLLLGLGLLSGRAFRGAADDYFLAGRTIGPVLLLMSVFGTSMTAFALVGSSGEAYRAGIGVYGMMASWSGLIHGAVFFFVGIRLWAIGKRRGYLTQIQFFRERFESDALGLVLFPILVGLVIPYLLTGLLGAGSVVRSLSVGAFPEAFADTQGGVPPWLTGLVVSAVVLLYVSYGGMRGAVWANAFQTTVFMLTGLIAFYLIADKLGGAAEATRRVLETHPERLIRGDEIPPLVFFSYLFIPLSIGAFPHVFQHWLTARSAETFKLTLVAHPIFILVVWVPCVLIGVWATAATADGSLVVPPGSAPNSELAIMVQRLTAPALGGLLGAGILAAIMSSLDSQFLALSSMFANDIAAHYLGAERVNDRRKVTLGRAFVVLVVAVTYLFSLAEPRAVFTLGVWCFSGFSALFPLVVAALYWRRATRAGAMVSLAVTALVWFLLFRESGYGADGAYLFLGMLPAATLFFCSATTLVGVSLVTEAPSEETLRKFFPDAPRRLAPSEAAREPA